MKHLLHEYHYKISQPCSKILIIGHFGTLHACVATPNQNIIIILQLFWNTYYIQSIFTITQQCPWKLIVILAPKYTKIILQLLWNTSYMQNIHPITQPCPKIIILVILVFWVCPNMPDPAQQKFYDYLEALMEYQLQAKYQCNNSTIF